MSGTGRPPDRRTNLVAPVTSFVGRSADLQTIDDLLETSRLLTLVGPPGAGKSRLALEYARRRLTDLAQPGCGGVWLCELGEARTSAGICHAVARALDVMLTSEAAPAESVARLGAAIAARGPLLLVLDNFEQVARHAADVLVPWLQQAGEVVLVVTSRVRLAVPAEATFEVGPLGLPGPRPSADTALTSDAVQLLVQRARAVRHDFIPTSADALMLAEVAQRLDGLPLAIELAGSRMAILGPKQLLERLSAAQVGVARALHATLEWSWNLLEPEEQSALAQLSAFRGGFMLEAAEALLQLPPGSRAPLDVLASLRDNSLLRVTHAPELPGEVRFALLDTIRSYAEEKLAASGDAETIRRRHAAYYLHAADGWSAEVERQNGPEALSRLAVELPNLVEVHGRALASRDPADLAQAFSAVLALEHVFYMRGPTALCLALLDAAFERTPTGVPRRLLALARKARARALRDLGRLDESVAELDRALAIARALGDRGLEGRIVGHVAFLKRMQGDPTEALAALELALEYVRCAGDQRSEGMVLASLGQVLGDLGRFEAAAAAYDEALRIDRAVGNRYGAGFVLASRAELNRARGMLAAAQVDLEQGLTVYREFGERRHEATALCELGAIHHARGRVAEARASYERSIACHREYGSCLAGTALGRLADLERDEGHMELARGHYTEALMLARELADDRAQERLLASLANIEASPDRTRRPASREASLVIAESGRWFRVAGRETVSLQRRHALRLVLRAFLAQRLAAPGQALSQAKVLEAGWPGEKVGAQAGILRVYNALSTLRKLGLRELLLSRDDGYLLDPRQVVIRGGEDDC